MKIDLTEKEWDLITATLARAITVYEDMDQKDSVLDAMMSDMSSIIGKIHVKKIKNGAEKFSFKGEGTVKDIEGFKKFIEEKIRQAEEKEKRGLKYE